MRYKLMFCIQFGRNSIFKVLQYIFAHYLPCTRINHVFFSFSCDIYSKLRPLFCTDCSAFNYLLWCDTVQSGKHLLTIRRDLLPLSFTLKMGASFLSETSIRIFCTARCLVLEDSTDSSYVYWTVHHCDSWRIKDQLNCTCYFISLLMCSTYFRH